jgi:hypothetical protein
MIDFRGDLKQLKRIDRAIALFSCGDYDKLYTVVSNRLPHQDDWNLYSASINFGFSHTGRPTAGQIEGQLVSHGLVSMERSAYGRCFRKCVMRFGDKLLTVLYGHSGHVDQIYLTINKDHPEYKVHTLGKSFAINQDKHPDFFLSPDELSYAVLLGQEPMVGAAEFIARAECIFNFALILESCVMINKGGDMNLYKAVTQSAAFIDTHRIQ